MIAKRERDSGDRKGGGSDNFFVTRLFGWVSRDSIGILPRVNALLSAVRVPWVVHRKLDPTWEMTSVEQRLSLWHLATQPFAYGVPGDAVELGCFDGKTATIFGRVLQQCAPDRQLHLFDRFDMHFHLEGHDIEQEVDTNFRTAGLPPPVIHKGDFAQTVPWRLPQRIAFAHIDCGYGGPKDEHKRTLLHVLEHVYSRMPPGAVGVLMDYHDPALSTTPDYNPATAIAAHEFFADKPESVSALWGGEYSHGYFRKQ